VRKLIDQSTAEVAVRRFSACGENCANCGLCDTAKTVTAAAVNTIGAKPGDTVIVRTESSVILRAAAAAYLLPLAALLFGCIIAAAFGLSQNGTVIAGILGLILGLAASVITRRLTRSKIQYEIVGKGTIMLGKKQ